MSSTVSSSETILTDGRMRSTDRRFQLLDAIGAWRTYLGSLFLNDALMSGLAFRLAYWIRFELNLGIFRTDVVPEFGYYLRLVLFLIPTVLIVFAATGLYRRENLLGGPGEYSLVFRASTTTMLLVVMAGFIEPELVIARGWLILAWGLVFLLVSSGRFLLRRLVYLLRGHGYFLTRAAIIGANAEGLSLAKQLIQWTTSGMRLIGFIDDSVQEAPLATGLPLLGTPEQLGKIIKEHELEDIIIATSSLSRDQMLGIFKQFGFSSEVNLRMASGLFEIITTGLNVKEFAYVPLVEVNKVRLTGSDRVLKKALDFAIAVPGLIAIAPLLLIVAIVVKLSSPGPIIHRRRVMGVNGREFDAFKFRTMYVNGSEILAADPELLEEFNRDVKLKDDPRVTPVGRVLRRFSLDELPQLLNVIRGEMSLVGPRMISPPEIGRYDQWGFNLLTVRPGITGMWQVSGRSDLSYQDRVQLDMHYIRNWTIWMDLQILFQTIPAVLRTRGAY